MLGHAEDLKGLLLGHESTLNSESFMSYFFAVFVAMLLRCLPGVLFPPEISNFSQSFGCTDDFNELGSGCFGFIGDCLEWLGKWLALLARHAVLRHGFFLNFLGLGEFRGLFLMRDAHPEKRVPSF